MKKHINIQAGTTNSKYCEEIRIALSNGSNENFVILQGDRIAQSIFMQLPKFIIETCDSLSESDQDGGFGSTEK